MDEFPLRHCSCFEIRSREKKAIESYRVSVEKLIESLEAGNPYQGQFKEELTRLRRAPCEWSVVVKKNPIDTVAEAGARFEDLLDLVRKTIGPALVRGKNGKVEKRRFPYQGQTTDELTAMAMDILRLQAKAQNYLDK